MTTKFLVNLIDCTKRGGLSSLVDEDIVVIVRVFMGKTLYSHSASLSTNETL